MHNVLVTLYHPTTILTINYSHYSHDTDTHRVPAEMKGPLDTHWKIRDKQGYILNNDGTKSVCVHQWDRWEDELIKFVDSKLYDQ